MASRLLVQSGHGIHGGRSGGGRGNSDHQEDERQQQKYPVDSPLWKYVTKIGKKEKNMGGSCLWNCSK
jgi:hypothetical protein